MTHEEWQDIKRRVEGYVELTDAITATMGILRAQVVELEHDINNLAEVVQLREAAIEDAIQSTKLEAL